MMTSRPGYLLKWQTPLVGWLPSVSSYLFFRVSLRAKAVACEPHAGS